MKMRKWLVMVSIFVMTTMCAHARYYDASIGRFISADSVVSTPGDPQNLNRYSYVQNNPVILSDPSGNFPIIGIVAAIGAIYGGYRGYEIAKDKGYNLSDWQTYAFMQGSGMIGAAASGGGAYLGNMGVPLTASIMFGSALDSMGMYAMTGGRSAIGISVGAASYNSETGWDSFRDGNNKWYTDVAYALGALANLQDIVAGFNGKAIDVNSASTKKPHEAWGHSSITRNKEINISVGPAEGSSKGPFGVRQGKLWENYANEAQTWKINIPNVNQKILQRLSSNINQGKGLFFGDLKWNLSGFSCVNHTSRALWAAGIPTLPINFHPLILNAQLTARQLGIYSSTFLLDQGD